jgi:hypothetical protein
MKEIVYLPGKVCDQYISGNFLFMSRLLNLMSRRIMSVELLRTNGWITAAAYHQRKPISYIDKLPVALRLLEGCPGLN